ncbi:MAG: outer membrane beta-barrel protein [Gemmatimonadota bacterium]
MRAAGLAVALLTGLAAAASAQDSRFRLNPYAGWYHFDESSFEKGFETSDVESDLVYGLRLAIGGLGGWSLDLAYGRTQFGARGPLPEGDGNAGEVAGARIQLFYGALNWHLPLTGPLDLFLSGGVGGIDTDFHDDDGAHTDVLVNYGAGVAIPAGPLRVRADLKDQVDLCNAPEEFDPEALSACFEDEALHNIEFTAGLELPL